MKLKASFSSLFLILGISSFPAVEAANFQPLDFSKSANTNLQQKNPLFPKGLFLTRFAVPFVIPDVGNNVWGSGNGVEGSCFCMDGTYSLVVPVNRRGIQSIYTLADTGWGRNGEQLFKVIAYFDNGRQATWTYVDGQQLRDWNLYPAFANTINGTNTNEVFRVSPPLPVLDGNADVMDMQTLAVPYELQGATLQTLVVVDQRRSVGMIHSGFVSGITVSEVGPVTPALAPVLGWIPDPTKP